ncbi:steroid-binding protein [Clostridium sp. DJ247]|nr:steroid-binding protein [Clostridium sp. DJ247]
MQKLFSIQEKITYYTENMMIVACPYIKNYYGCLIKNEIKEAKELISIVCKEKMNNNRLREIQKQFTLEELSKYDGSSGAPAYVAVDGIVYDVSLAPGWGGGTHFSLYAGKDLTNQFKACHNGIIKILESLPKVGQLKA